MSDVLCMYYSRSGHTKKAAEEIAQALNLTESTVRGRLARARSLVMRQMKEWA